MPRHHTIWDAAQQKQIDIPFTLEEEATRDAEAAAWASEASVRAAAEVQRNRRNAYQVEADPLFFEEQAGEVASGTWTAKRSEIKSRFPK